MTDYALGSTFDVKFTSRRFSTGAPFTLAGTPTVAAYPDNSLTEVTAGLTLSTDFDARTGLNNIRVVATGANGYAAGSSYALVITAGTVDAVSVVGEVVGQFTIERGAAFARLGAPAGASVSADVAAVKTDTAAILVDTGTTLDARIPAALVGGRMDASVGAMAAGVVTAAAVATGAIDADALAADAVTEIRSLASGTADSGTTTTMADAARTEADADYWKGCRILFTSGTISGQVRLITGFDPATDTITFAPATTLAVATQTYEILPAARADVELWDGAAVNALVSGRVDASVGAMAANVVTASAIAADAITDAKVAADVTIASVTGAVGSVTGAVGSVTGAVGSVAAGGITAASFGAGAIDAAAIATDAIGAAELSQAAADKVWSTATRALTDKAGFTLTAAERDNIVKAASGTADSGSTTTIVDAERTEADTDYWAGSLVLMTSGAAVGQVRRISAFAPATDTITVANAFTAAIAVGNTYLILRTSALEAPGAGATDWTTAEKQQIRDALGVDGTKTGAVGGQVQAVKAKTDQIVFTTANKVDASIQAAGDFAQAAADKVWSTAARSLTDKVGFALSAAGIQAIWDALTSALTFAGSIGKLLVDNINATVSSRASQASVDALPTATANADALLKRDMSLVTGEAARSPLNALRAVRNKTSIAGSTLTVTKEDDITSAWTAAVTTDAAANPVTAVDPV